jgi:nucleoside-diphosphate-sugar epimerase
MRRLTILITGSNGIIGEILKENLSDEFDIVGLDKKDGGDKYAKVDISNYADLDSAFHKMVSIDCVVHLAADPREDAEWEAVLINNIIGTRNVYECAKKHGIGKVVFASSGHVTGSYGTSHLITTRDPVRPDGDYGSSKAFGEIIARQYADLYGIKSICLRIGWVKRDDNPTINQRAMKMWLSHKDLVELVRKGILSNVEFGVYYGVSNNSSRFWSISNAEKELGYNPKDDSWSRTGKSFSFLRAAYRIQKHMRKLLSCR